MRTINISESTWQEINKFLEANKCPMIDSIVEFELEISAKYFRDKFRAWRKANGLPPYSFRNEKERPVAKASPDVSSRLPKPYKEPHFGMFEDCHRAAMDGGTGRDMRTWI